MLVLGRGELKVFFKFGLKVVLGSGGLSEWKEGLGSGREILG